MVINNNFFHQPIPDLANILNSPSQLRYEERVILFGLIVGLKPERILEIGTAFGGTAWLMVQALDYIGKGELVSLDISREWIDDIKTSIQHRARWVKGKSPDSLASLGTFDFVFIDGNHDMVLADIEGLLPIIQPGTRLVFHDYLYEPTMRDIKLALAKYPQLHDGGYLTIDPIINLGHDEGGLYLLWL